MKRELILSTFAIVAMVSCSKTEVSDPASGSLSTEGTPIEVTTFVDRATKGAVGDQTTLQTDGFNVIAFEPQSTENWTVGTTETVDTVMGTAKVDPDTDVPCYVSYTPGTWNYVDDNQEIVYWNGYLVSFFAYSPKSQTTDATIIPEFSDNTALPTITFTTEETIADQIDLLAYSDMNRKNDGNPVSFNFNHVLSKIGFTVTSSLKTDNTAVAITDIKIAVDDTREYNDDLDAAGDDIMKYKSGKYLHKCGIFTFSGTTGTDDASWKTLDEGDTDDTNGALSTDALVIEDNSIINTDLYNYNTDNPSTPAEAGLDGATSFYLAKDDTAAYDIMADDAYLMIIPQELEAGDIISVTVTYRYITSTNSTPEVGTGGELIKKVYIPAIDYEQGKQYTYNIKVGQDAIVFDSTIGVAGWEDGDTASSGGDLGL